MIIDPRKIKRATGETRSYYPGKDNAEVVRVIDSEKTGDASTIEVTVKKHELELALFLKKAVFPHLNENTQTRLLNLIDNFGDERYDEGDFNAVYDG